MGVNCRCKNRRGCGKRITLKQPLRWYVKEPVCPDCGGPLSDVSVKEKARSTRRTCHCSGIGWPHRHGTIVDAHRTCHQALEEDVFHRDLGVVETTVNADEAPW